MKLANIWSNGIVVQQKKKIRIWGKSNGGDKIHISLVRERDHALIEARDVITDESGQFLAELQPANASYDVYTLTCCCGEEQVRIEDILIGEVWLTCGQSNMFLPIIQTMDKDDLLSRSGNKNIRFLTTWGSGETVNGYPVLPYQPQYDIYYDGWHDTVNPKIIEWLSCIGFTFALSIYEKLQVPVGLINTSVGGSKIDAWLSAEVIEHNKSIKKYLQMTSRYIDEEHYNKQGETNFTQNSGLFNERIAPITNFNIRGVLWLQGESNAGKGEKEASYYVNAFHLLINDWNRRFRCKKQPFIFTHIAYQNYQFDPMWVALLNEALDDVSKKNANFAIQVPIYDLPLDWKIPNELYCHPIHPVLKGIVGDRIAKIVLSKVYHFDEEYDVPVLKDFTICDDKVVLNFYGTGNSLIAHGGKTLRGFTLCGESGVHQEADAVINGTNQVVLSNKNIRHPKGAAYAFAPDNQYANLVNSGGIPAVPFRSGRKDEIYYFINPWMSCDHEKTWVNCFEWAMGMTEYKPVWKGATLSGTEKATISFDSTVKSEGDQSVKIVYEPDIDKGNIIGLSPMIHYTGQYHQMEKFDYLTFDINNPDDRGKIFIGILIKTLTGKVYILPIEENGQYKPYISIPANSGFKQYKASLKTFCGCYMVREEKKPSDMSDVTDMQFTFMDEQKGSIYIDNIRFQ